MTERDQGLPEPEIDGKFPTMTPDDEAPVIDELESVEIDEEARADTLGEQTASEYLNDVFDGAAEMSDAVGALAEFMMYAGQLIGEGIVTADEVRTTALSRGYEPEEIEEELELGGWADQVRDVNAYDKIFEESAERRASEENE